MTNYEYNKSDNDIEQAIERDELVDRYLNERDISYDELIALLEQHGGRLVFHDSVQLAQITAAFPLGTAVEFSEQQIPGDYQSGTIIEGCFLVPLASIDRPQNIYRPQLCATIQDAHGTVDTLLFPIRKHSNGELGVSGIQVYSID